MPFPIIGRKCKVYRATSSPRILVAGCKTKTFTINGEPADTTNDDDNGWRTLLADAPAIRSMDFSLEGLAKDTLFIEQLLAASPTLITQYELDFDTIGIFAGRFAVTSIEIGANYNEACSFSANFMSDQAITFTAAS